LKIPIVKKVRGNANSDHNNAQGFPIHIELVLDSCTNFSYNERAYIKDVSVSVHYEKT